MSNMNIAYRSTGQNARGNARRKVLVKATALALAIATFASVQQEASADPVSRAQAKRMYDRLVGTPPTPALLDDLEARVAADKVAAGLYMLDPSSPRSSQFYTTTLKNFATPWTNRDQTVFAPLNDYTATIIGMVRDDADFRGILSDDVVYVGSGTSPAYSPASNAHYEALENNNADLRTVLQATTQSSLNGLPPGEPVIGTLMVPPGQVVELDTEVTFIAAAPFRFFDLVLAVDEPGGGAGLVDVLSMGLASGPIPPPPPPCPPDLNGDGFVDSLDLNLVLASFGCTGGDCGGDTDGDGDTDSVDLNVVLADFGQNCP